MGRTHLKTIKRWQKLPDIDLDEMSMEDLRTLRAQIDRAIASFEDRKRRDALAAVERAAREHGFALSDLTTPRGGKGRRAAAPAGRPASEARYANPDEPSMTWSGRGRRPRWVSEQIGAGKSLEDMAI